MRLLNESHPRVFQTTTLPLFRAFQVRLKYDQLFQIQIRKGSLDQVSLTWDFKRLKNPGVTVLQVILIQIVLNILGLLNEIDPGVFQTITLSFLIKTLFQARLGLVRLGQTQLGQIRLTQNFEHSRNPGETFLQVIQYFRIIRHFQSELHALKGLSNILHFSVISLANFGHGSQVPHPCYYNTFKRINCISSSCLLRD